MLARLRAFFSPAAADPLRAPRRIFWVGFAVRVLYLTLAHTYRIRPAEDHFQFGWEAGRIARALVTGYGYSDPFSNVYFAHTGPTAWLPPLYPLLLAAIFKVFGIFTPASAWVLFTVQSAFSAATALATYEIAARILNRRVALWSAWIWALYPAAMQYAVRWPWEMTITTALFSFVFVLALRMREIGRLVLPEPAAARSRSRERVILIQLIGIAAFLFILSLSSDAMESAIKWLLGFALAALVIGFTTVVLLRMRHADGKNDNPQTATNWILFGLCWALIALSNSTLLIFLPVCGIWILLGTWHGPRTLTGPLLAALVFIACIAPWTLRNSRVFDTFIPLRGNFGAELYMGNGPGGTGFLMEYYHPFQDPQQLRDYATLGEVRYVARQGAAAKANIAADPAHFAADVGRRIYFFWAGVPHPSDEAWYNEVGRTLNFAFISLAGVFGLALALRNRVPAAGLFAWAFLLLPLPYYLVTVHARFRHPLEPLIAILGVYLFQSASRAKKVAAA